MKIGYEFTTYVYATKKSSLVIYTMQSRTDPIIRLVACCDRERKAGSDILLIR